MKNKIGFLIAGLILLNFAACNDEEPQSLNGDCVFEQVDGDEDGLIDETERSIMDDCRNNALNSKSEIESNLIGEWELVGHGEGWVATISQPCSHIIITDSNLEWSISDGWKDTTILTTWEIQEAITPAGNFYNLRVASDFAYGLHLGQFCERYMFGDATPVDGNMYLYEKIK